MRTSFDFRVSRFAFSLRVDGLIAPGVRWRVRDVNAFVADYRMNLVDDQRPCCLQHATPAFAGQQDVQRFRRRLRQCEAAAWSLPCARLLVCHRFGQTCEC